MNCDGVRELLSAYVDGELSSGELLRVEQHLRRCPVCAEEVDALRQTIAFVGLLTEVEVPAGFREGLRARLAEVSPQIQPLRPVASTRPAWHRQAARWALPAAAAAAFALASTGVYGQMGNIFNRVATNTNPKPEVVTPSVPDTTNPVQSSQPPVTPSGSTPSGGNVAQVDPAKPSVTPSTEPSQPSVKETTPVVEPNPKTTEGPTANPGDGPAVATLVSQVPAPATLRAQVSYMTAMQAVVPDLTAACNQLKSAYQADCTTKQAGQQVQVTLAVAADKGDATQAAITAMFVSGATAYTAPTNLTAQLQAAFERVATLSEEISKLEQQVSIATSAEQKTSDQALLAQKQSEGQAAVADYNRLLTQINTRLFVIDLQKQGQ